MAETKKQYWWLLLLLIPLARKKTPTTTTTSCVIVPDEENAKPLYGGDFIIKVKPNTQVFARANTASGRIATKNGCYLEGWHLQGDTNWMHVVNRTGRNEQDFNGYIPITSIEKIIYEQ